MVLTVTAIEDIKPHGFVSLLFNDGARVVRRGSLTREPPDAIAARFIAQGESITFDSGQNTDDLLRPLKEHYDRQD
jgi:hypothetical protein